MLRPYAPPKPQYFGQNRNSSASNMMQKAAHYKNISSSKARKTKATQNRTRIRAMPRRFLVTQIIITKDLQSTRNKVSLE